MGIRSNKDKIKINISFLVLERGAKTDKREEKRKEEEEEEKRKEERRIGKRRS